MIIHHYISSSLRECSARALKEHSMLHGLHRQEHSRPRGGWMMMNQEGLRPATTYL